MGKGRPFSAVTVEDYSVFERSSESSSEDTVHLWVGPGPEGERLESVASPAPASILRQASLPGIRVPPSQPLAHAVTPSSSPFKGTPVLTLLLPSIPFQQPTPNGVFLDIPLLINGAPPDSPNALWLCMKSLFLRPRTSHWGNGPEWSWWCSAGGQSRAHLHISWQPSPWAPCGKTVAGLGKMCYWIVLQRLIGQLPWCGSYACSWPFSAVLWEASLLDPRQ